MIVYVIGSLQNKIIPVISKRLRKSGFETYDEWWCPGEFADKHWQSYCKSRGLTYQEALKGWHAKQVFEIDKFHLDRCDAGILVLPAGRSGHLELGYLIGSRKPGYILLDKEPDRYDLMYKFATMVTIRLDEILDDIKSVMTGHVTYNSNNSSHMYGSS